MAQQVKPTWTTDGAHGVSISWVKSHRRSDEIAEVVGVAPIFVRAPSRTLVQRYLKQFRMTNAILRRENPSVVVVMQPPPLALAAVLGFARKNRSVVIGDLHSGVFFDRKWRWAHRWVLNRLKRYGGAIVPNSELKRICTDHGVTTFVSHGLVRELQHDHSTCIESVLPASADCDFVLVPLTYSRDEPVAELLAAARLTPEVTWVLTGRAPFEVRDKASNNVVFTGFVSNVEYRTLRHHASAVLALTKQPSTMQSAGYEAIATATPLVTVPHAVLRDYFGESALYSPLTPSALHNSVVRILDEKDVWGQRMSALRDEIIGTQHEPSEEIDSWISDLLACRGIFRTVKVSNYRA